MRQKVVRNNFFKTPNKPVINYNNPIGIRWGEIKEILDIDDIIIVRSGPSVNDIDLNYLKQYAERTNAYIIAVNGAGEHVNFADAWFTLDPWGLNGSQIPKNFSGELYAAVPDDYGTPTAKSLQHRVSPNSAVTFLHRLQSHNFINVSSETAYTLGLSEDRRCISTGNSGYGALNMAYLLKPKRIFLLGIDGTIGYFYSSKVVNKQLTYLKQLFKSAVPQLDKHGIKVYTVNPKSTVDAFEKITPDKFYELMQQ